MNGVPFILPLLVKEKGREIRRLACLLVPDIPQHGTRHGRCSSILSQLLILSFQIGGDTGRENEGEAM